MYKVYRLIEDGTNKFSRAPYYILAREKKLSPSSISSKFIEGIYLGSEGYNTSHLVGYYSRNWSKRGFRECSDQITIRSKKEIIFSHNGSIYIKGRIKNVGSVIWNLTKDSDIVRIDEDDFRKMDASPLGEFKIKNK